MQIKEQIEKYIASIPEPKRSYLRTLHNIILQINPTTKLWFLDGKNSENKIVANPNIGYGLCNIKYADGNTKAFYKIGISANQTGISMYIMGLEDKKHLIETFGKTIGKASVTGYCIKFKKLQDINLDVLEAVIRFGFDNM